MSQLNIFKSMSVYTEFIFRAYLLRPGLWEKIQTTIMACKHSFHSGPFQGILINFCRSHFNCANHNKYSRKCSQAHMNKHNPNYFSDLTFKTVCTAKFSLLFTFFVDGVTICNDYPNVVWIKFTNKQFDSRHCGWLCLIAVRSTISVFFRLRTHSALFMGK